MVSSGGRQDLGSMAQGLQLLTDGLALESERRGTA